MNNDDHSKKQPTVWHARSVDEVAKELGVQPACGLTTDEVERRRSTYGANVLPHAPPPSSILRFLQQFNNPLIIILLISGGVSAALGGVTDAGVIIGVVLLNAIIGFVQEGKAVQALTALSTSIGTECTVIRGGLRTMIASTELVPGDIVEIDSGDKIPADLRLLRVHECRIAEAALTGESVAVEKATGSIAPEAVLADRTNMAYAATICVAGTAVGVVVATGSHTEVGTISVLLANTVSLTTPLTQTIEHFSKRLLIGILGLAAVTMAVGLMRGEKIVDMVLAAVALSVGAIPEGLPAAVTIILAIGVGRMAKRRAIIRRLPAVETLGSTTVICSDKTGTLTQNQMTVVNVFSGDEVLAVSGTGYLPEGSIVDARGEVMEPHEDLRALIRSAILCNTSDVRNVDGEWVAIGDPTESALIVLGMKCSMSRESELRDRPYIDAIPFSSENQCMATLHDEEGGSYVAMKGSVEAVLSRCTSDVNRDVVMDTVLALSGGGLRVLAFAEKRMSSRQSSMDISMIADGMTFLGLVAMVDPPREEAKAAIAECLQAGIAVKMITGDHAVTAATIARQLGLHGKRDGDTLVALTGTQLGSMSAEEFATAAREVAVFARVTPEQKLRLVESLQADGHVVAMTGDGVNDAPALRKADIGIAMGKSGTDVAKDAAAMVLTDDNFITIVHAVEEGRTVFDNLLKFIVWTIPTNIGEGLVIVAAIAVDVALPILPVQILWINMTTAVILGLPLAFEPLQPNAMRKKPRGRGEPLLSSALLFRTIFVGLLLLCGSFSIFLFELAQGETLALARTASSNAFVVMSTLYVFSCRTLVEPVHTVGYFSNMYVWGAAVLMMALQLLYTYAPFMQAWFHTAPLGWTEWAFVMASGIVVIVLITIEKKIRALVSRS
ncbi:cation-transporting P-type ATPase [soil metagenome]